MEILTGLAAVKRNQEFNIQNNLNLISDLQERLRFLEATGRANAYAMVQAQTKIENLTHHLQWALNELSDEDQEHTPKHDCEFRTDPESGHCDFCDKYWSAMNAAWPVQE